MGIVVTSVLLLFGVSLAQQQDILPAKLPPASVSGENSGTCPSAEVLDRLRNETKGAITSILQDNVIPLLERRSPPCPCGGPGPWRRVAHLDMSDPNQQCPPNWRLVTPARGCGRSTAGESCDSAIFPADNRPYSRVCGRVIAYQEGDPEAFSPTLNGRNPRLESAYIDGVSLTRGAVGSRQHIWTFAAAKYETALSYEVLYTCSCTNTNFNWPYQLPSFIGTNYFCDTGNRGPSTSTTRVYSEDPLWDGEGCGLTSTCCQFNTPPWFCTALPQPSAEDIELRICSNGRSGGREDILVRLVDVYIK